MLIRSWEGWGRLPGRTGTFRVALQAADLGLGDCVGTPQLSGSLLMTLKDVPLSHVGS